MTISAKAKAPWVAGIVLSAAAVVYFAQQTVHTETIVEPQTHKTVKSLDISPAAGLGAMASVVGVGLFSAGLAGKLKP